jgi:hypothetical protein
LYELLTSSGNQTTGPFFNTAVLFDRNGTYAGRYRKFFPTVDLPDGETLTGVLPGDLGVPVFDTDFGRIAILICWDMDFPELWQAAHAQGAELVLWPAAAKGAHPVDGYALIHNMYIAAVGHGQFYDRIGRELPPDAAVNYTLPHADSDKHRTAQIFVKRLDLDAAVVFCGGAHALQQRYTAFLAQYAGRIQEAYHGNISEWSMISAVPGGGVSVRTALRMAGIETRREQAIRNRRVNNQLRSSSPPPPPPPPQPQPQPPLPLARGVDAGGEAEGDSIDRLNARVAELEAEVIRLQGMQGRGGGQVADSTS